MKLIKKSLIFTIIVPFLTLFTNLFSFISLTSCSGNSNIPNFDIYGKSNYWGAPELVPSIQVESNYDKIDFECSTSLPNDEYIITWTVSTTNMENIVYFSDTITNQLEILNGQAQGFNGQFVISASAKQKSTNETKKITYPVNFNVVPIDAKIPLNDHFFTFSDDEKTTILDFSIDLLNAAKESTTAVDAYLFGRSILDLSGKKIDGDATFSPKYNPTSLENGCNENINRILTKITEINLSGAIFLPKIINNECKTGFLTFGRIINGSETTIPPPPVSAEDTTNGCYLANVQKLDLSGAIFAQTNMSNNTDICKTAANTFANANLSGLTNNNLILTNTNFASTNMAINTNNIYTAYQTFSTAIISNSLNFNLSLENTNFAVDNMTSSVTSIYTAANTFGNSILTTTNTISLSNAKFAAHSMCNGGIHTAYQTFLVDTSDTYQTITNSFPAINQLILDNAVFSIDNMASENNNSSIYIAESTFNKANFSNLSTLNLNNISFVPNNLSIANNVSNIFVAASTFSETNLNGLNILNVNAKFACEQITKNASVSTAYCTFMNAKLDNVTNLDLTNAIFCVSNMISTNGSGSIKTADSLFKKVIFSGLQSLNLTNVNFACSDMGYNGSIFTANSTFESAEFTALTSLNVNATYITTSIVSELSSSSEIDIGCGTFSKAKFDVLQSLDLSQTIFAATNIINSSATSNIGAKIYTAASTFSFAEFTTLNSLNFNATYTIDNINNTSASIFTASQTFASTSIPSIQNIDLSNINFASSQMTTNGRVFTGFNTFSGLILSTSTTTLIFNNTKFVANSMSTSDNALIWTAYCTFMNIDFSNTSNLNFSGLIVSVSNIAQIAEVHTAYQTFSHSKFNYLNISSFVFASSNMINGGTIFAADSTFFGIDLSEITTPTNFIFSGATYCASNMLNYADDTSSINIANQLFSTSDFSELATIDFNGVIFSIANMTNAKNINIGSMLFANANFKNVENLNLNNGIFTSNNMTSASNNLSISSLDGAFYSVFVENNKSNVNINVGALNPIGNNSNNGISLSTFFNTNNDNITNITFKASNDVSFWNIPYPPDQDPPSTTLLLDYCFTSGKWTFQQV